MTNKDRMREYFKEINLKYGQTFKKRDLRNWLCNKYPEYKESNLDPDLTQISVNAPSRKHYNVRKDGSDNILWKIDKDTFRLYDKTKDTLLDIDTRNNTTLDKDNIKITNLKCTSEKVMKFHKLMEMDIDKGFRTIDWNELLIRANISQPYSHKVREAKSELKTIALKWQKLPKLDETTKNEKITGNLSDEEKCYLHDESKARIAMTKQIARSSKARNECIRLKGCYCNICGFNFEEKYGDIGKDYIEVHHITLISESSISNSYKGTNPKKDLIPLCSNCHSIIHRKNPPYSPEEIKLLFQKG